ncbi:hypothetical protein RUND412_001665 [Rhizina undulata]
MSPPNSQPQSSRQARIAAMESRLDELLVSQRNDQNSRKLQLFSKKKELVINLMTTLASVNEKIEALDGQPDGDNTPQYSRLKSTEGDLLRKMDKLSENIANEKKAYEEDRENSVDGKIIRNLQMLIEFERAWEKN